MYLLLPILILSILPLLSFVRIHTLPDPYQATPAEIWVEYALSDGGPFERELLIDCFTRTFTHHEVDEAIDRLIMKAIIKSTDHGFVYQSPGTIAVMELLSEVGHHQ